MVGAGIVPFLRLKLEEYTSLCAELSVRTERSAEILRSYQVLSKAAHGALDEQSQEHFAGHPEDARGVREGPRTVHGLAAQGDGSDAKLQLLAGRVACGWAGRDRRGAPHHCTLNLSSDSGIQARKLRHQ
jgi:hypothetical protein